MEAALAANGGVQNAESATLQTLLQRARVIDAQVGAQRRDNLNAGPPSGLTRSLGTRRFEKCPRVVQVDVRGSRPFVGGCPQPNHPPWRTWSCREGGCSSVRVVGLPSG